MFFSLALCEVSDQKRRRIIWDATGDQDLQAGIVCIQTKWWVIIGTDEISLTTMIVFKCA